MNPNNLTRSLRQSLYIKIIPTNMNILKIVKTKLRKIDLFGSSEYLRFKGEGKYQTLTGGVVTLILIILFSIVFLQSLDSVIHKDSVTSSDAVYYLTDPTSTSFKISDSKFIFGIGITKYNLNDKFRYFDITLTTEIFSNGEFKDQIIHSFQPCQESQWAQVGQLGKESYHKMLLDGFLCPPPDLTIQMEGKFTSDIFKLLRIRVSKCKNSTDPSRPCVSQAQLKKVSYFNMNFYFMNAFVNGGDLEPVGYYLEDKNYFPFTLSSTLINNIDLSQHIINTDTSLLPNQFVESKTILLVKDLAESKSSSSVPDEYVNIYLRKSSQYMVSTRSFKKLDTLFSFIGGLFGFAIAFFFILNLYNEASFEVDMGNKLFHINSPSPQEKVKFNFLTFLGFSLYSFLKLFKDQIPWKRMKEFQECKEEVNEQLDLATFMNKIIFLEKCMSVLLEEHQFRAIYMQQRLTVAEAKYQRLSQGSVKCVKDPSKKISLTLQSKLSIDIYKDSDLNSRKQAVVSSQIYQNGSILSKIGGQILRINSLNEQDIVETIKQYGKKFEKKSVIESFKHPQKRVVQTNLNKRERSADSERQKIESFKYLNTVMSDIQLIQQESKQGNRISLRIYERVNIQVIKQKFLALQCLEKLSLKIFEEKTEEQSQSYKQKIFQVGKKDMLEKKINSSIKSNIKKTEDIVIHGHEIELDTNNRLEKNYL